MSNRVIHFPHRGPTPDRSDHVNALSDALLNLSMFVMKMSDRTDALEARMEMLEAWENMHMQGGEEL